MNLTAGNLIRSGVSNSYSMEYTYRNSYIIGYISEYHGVIKALGGYETKRTSLY